MSEDLSEWIRLTRQQDELYHRFAKEAGLADAQFWILYALCESEGPLCQNALCENWCYSKQTVNTAVSHLEKENLVQLTFSQGSRKKKDLHLTEEGKAFCHRYIKKVQDAEEKALNKLSQAEKENFFSVFRVLLRHVDDEISKDANQAPKKGF